MPAKSAIGDLDETARAAVIGLANTAGSLRCVKCYPPA
jgi:hypothetical protein